MDPAYTAHGMGYLTPTLFTFSRALDRERLARLPGATLTGAQSASPMWKRPAWPGRRPAAPRRTAESGRRAGGVRPTVAAAATSQVPPQMSWDERSFLDAALACRPEREVALMRELIAHVHALNGTLSWASMPPPGSLAGARVAGAPIRGLDHARHQRRPRIFGEIRADS